MSRVRSVAGLALWGAFLAVALKFLHHTPSPAAMPADGSGYVFAALRYSAVGVGWYLAATTILSVLAHTARSARAISLTERVTAAPLNRLTRAALGAAFAAATLAPTAAAAQAPAPVPVMTWVDDGPAPPPDPSPGDAGEPTEEDEEAELVEVVVAPGDHLWSLASRQLTAQLGREPTDRELTPYWLEVIRANRSRLRDAAAPDLIYPGDRVVLPSPRTFAK